MASVPFPVGAGSPVETITYSQDSFPVSASQSKSAIVPPIFDMASPVGAKQLGGGAHDVAIA